jgi:imidazolonepropionase
MSLLIRQARVVQGGGAPTLPCADVLIEGDKISAIDTNLRIPDPGKVNPVGTRSTASPSFSAVGDAVERVPTVSGRGLAGSVIEAEGRVLMPGFVDPHTHACWAGNRLDEWELKQRGTSYLEILQSGGGILSTVRAVRTASEAELTEGLLRRLQVMLENGTTTVEVKSGYGLTTRDELKMLRAIAAAARRFPGTVVPTALLGHAIDPDQAHFVDVVIEETLPAVSEAFPGITVDAFCEEGAWSLADCRRLFERARALGHPLRLHADQFHSLGALEMALELGARSVDHLEATTPENLARLARSTTYGVMLPACGFHLDDRYANARAFLDAGGKLVLATNCNPGSAPTSSMPFILALAARKLRLRVPEAIAACTSVAAGLLGLPDRGRIAPGLRADLLLLRHRDERLLAFEIGGNPLEQVICAGLAAEGASSSVR